MENLAYYNGNVGTVDELMIPFNDRVHFFGDGVYEVTYAKNYKLFALEEHLDRFFSSAALIDLKLPHTKEEMAAILRDLVKKLDSDEQFVYFQATRGTQPRQHEYPEDMVANFWVMLKPGKIKDIKMEVKAQTAPDTRFYHCNIKTLNLLPAVMNAQAAKRSGMYENILYREGGRVTECSHSNVHIITEDGTFKTAPTDNLILPGIARAHLIKACRALGYKVDETPFTLEEMMAAREVIISSSSALGLRCVEIDGKPVGGRAEEMLSALQAWVLNEFFEETKA